MTSNGGVVVAVVKSDVVADTKRRSVVEVDNAGTISSALLVAEDQNRAWLRTSDDAFLVCTLDVGTEREERLVEWVAVALKLGIGVAVLSAVAVQVVGRRDLDMVLVVFSIDGSGGDHGFLSLKVREAWVHPGWVDVVSTGPLGCDGWNFDASVVLRVDFTTSWAVDLLKEVVDAQLLNDGTVFGAASVAEGCQNTALLLEDAAFTCDASGADGCEALILNMALTHGHLELTHEGGGIAVLADAETDVELILDWSVGADVRDSDGIDSVGDSKWDDRRVASDGRRVASDGNSSGDDGGDAEQLRDGQ